MKLFEDDWGQDDSPLEETEVTQVIFYFSKEETKLFKSLAKEGMKLEFENYIEDANVSDLMLKILKQKYAHLLPKKTFDASAVRETEIIIP